MPPRSPGYIHVDELTPRASLEQVAAFYGVPLPDLKRVGDETRLRCFLTCGRAEETGDRALAIQTDHPARPWQCHQYGCGKNGNLLGLMDLLKPGDNLGGRPRGARFKDLAADLQAIVEGPPPGAPPAAGSTATAAPTSTPPLPSPRAAAQKTRNLPLRASDNERARSLTNLDAKFVTDPAAMSPAAAGYFRRRPFLSAEACREWRVGYLPRDVGGGDKSGGTMRGRIVYAYRDEAGEVLTWFGRDPEFEEKHRRWEAAGRAGDEPEKFHFVQGFRRGQELFGQDGRRRLVRPEFRGHLKTFGLVVVEGPNDVLALDALDVPAVGLCSNAATDEQTEKLARWAHELAGGVVTLMLDCDPAGENGARQTIWKLAERCRVRLAWTCALYDGRFRGRQPESLTSEECALLRQDWLNR